MQTSGENCWRRQTYYLSLYYNKGVRFRATLKKISEKEHRQTETLSISPKYLRPDGPAWRDQVSQLLKLNDVEERVCLKRAKIYALIEEGDFPPPIKLSPGRSVWLADDIEGWINLRALESRKPVGGNDDQ